MQPCVYAIINEAGTKYIGSTTNLSKRLELHKRKGTTYTSKYRYWRLIGYVAFQNIADPRKYERLIKRNHTERDLFYNKIKQSGSSSIG